MTASWGDIVAVLALIQPWILSLWKRLFRRGKIEIYQTGDIEIGFSGLGPTVGLQGTLCSIHEDLFVRKIQFALIRKKDNYQRNFEWGIFRSHSYQLSKPSDIAVELPSGFMLLGAGPRRYNIQFWDIEAHQETTSLLRKLRQSWYDFFMNKAGKELVAQGVKLDEVLPAMQKEVEELFSEFSKQEAFVDIYRDITSVFYWLPGEYSIQLSVLAGRPERSFQRTWSFHLTKAEVDDLRINISRSLQEACARPYGQYFFVNTSYGGEAPVRLAASAP